jgi:hypothetical protein
VTDKWVYQLVSDILAYEEVHGSPKDGAICMHKTLALVPEDVKTVARAMVDASLDDHHKYLYE